MSTTVASVLPAGMGSFRATCDEKLDGSDSSMAKRWRSQGSDATNAAGGNDSLKSTLLTVVDPSYSREAGTERDREGEGLQKKKA